MKAIVYGSDTCPRCAETVLRLKDLGAEVETRDATKWVKCIGPSGKMLPMEEVRAKDEFGISIADRHTVFVQQCNGRIPLVQIGAGLYTWSHSLAVAHTKILAEKAKERRKKK